MAQSVQQAAFEEGRDQERERCVCIADEWARNADQLLGTGWRNEREIELATRVAESIARAIREPAPH